MSKFKFRYKDQVKIVAGFFEGHTGVITSEPLEINPNIYEVLVGEDFEARYFKINEDDMELMPSMYERLKAFFFGSKNGK